MVRGDFKPTADRPHTVYSDTDAPTRIVDDICIDCAGSGTCPCGPEQFDEDLDFCTCAGSGKCQICGGVGSLP
jgi:hypothetical protein